jgi:hypothetical protein
MLHEMTELMVAGVFHILLGMVLLQVNDYPIGTVVIKESIGLLPPLGGMAVDDLAGQRKGKALKQLLEKRFGSALP